MNALKAVKIHLEPGMVYRRSDLSRWSNAVDRHLSELQKDKSLVKLAGGLYFCPKETAFGSPPPNDNVLVAAFLKDTRFLMTTPNAYNSLGVGTTQLYNEIVVYNHKRHGRFKLGNRYFQFVVKHHFPSELTSEFLIVDLVDNLPKLAEDREALLKQIIRKVKSMDLTRLKNAVNDYGNLRAKKFFSALFESEGLLNEN